jgi:hypothetical protein
MSNAGSNARPTDIPHSSVCSHGRGGVASSGLEVGSMLSADGPDAPRIRCSVALIGSCRRGV